MRFTTSILLSILFCWGGISCTKGGGNIYVEGYVLNPITGEGIPNATVILRKASSGGAPGAQSAGFKTVKTVTTDANGYYELSHATILTKPYYVRVEEPSDQDYYHIGFAENESGVEVGNSQFKVDKGKNIIVDYQMVPYGYFKFKYVNQNCFDSNDEIEVYRSINYNDYYGFKNPIFYNGCTNFTQGGYAKVPSGVWYFRWIVTKNGVSNTYYDTVTLEGNEYNTYEFLY